MRQIANKEVETKGVRVDVQYIDPCCDTCAQKVANHCGKAQKGGKKMVVIDLGQRQCLEWFPREDVGGDLN